MDTIVDFIIVGQGLAGSVLALKLMENGYSVKVIDAPRSSACSKIAAGIWNPVVFKRLTKSWMIDEILPEMLRFYRKTETDLNLKLITERHIIKLFSEQQEIDLWKKKAVGELKNYLDPIIHYNNPYEGIAVSPMGFSKVLQAGNLDMAIFLSGVQDLLKQKESLLSETFDYKELIISNTVTYRTLSAKSIIFANGYLIKDNPLFNYIPLKPAKGEILTLKTSGIETGTDIINKNVFLMSQQANTYKLGATYNWEELNDLPTEKGLQELLSRSEKLITGGIKIVKHEAGVRPSVIDRRPVVGMHPKHQNVYVFNGMGTKGVMLAPYFAQDLVNFIRTGTPLNKEVDVLRFNRFFVN